MITVTRTNRATGRAFAQVFDDGTAEFDAAQFVMYSIYDHTKATRTAARAAARVIMALGHPVHQTETSMFLWTVNRHQG